MLNERLTRLFVRPQDRATSAVSLFWFSLSLVCALLFGLRGMHGALEEKHIIQDDARQHVFWMQRFTDPELFPDDLIANYYQTVAPSGYSFLYRIGAAAGIDPMRLSKILPILLGLITTAYCFGFTLQLLPVPFAAFLSSLLLNQALWSRDDIVSATARAFLYPLFMAFLYYLARRKFIPSLVALTLQALFYPFDSFCLRRNACARANRVERQAARRRSRQVCSLAMRYGDCSHRNRPCILRVEVFGLRRSDYGEPGATDGRVPGGRQGQFFSR